MTATKTVTVSQLREILNGISHAMPIAFSALVDAKAKKTGNPYGDISKLSRVQAFTGADYEKSVNRQLDREGKTQLEFTAKERSWGERVSPALVQNGGKFYLVAQVLKTAKPVYLVRKPWKLNAPNTGTILREQILTPIAKEAIAAFLPAVRPATNQGTEKEVVYRNYSLENLISVSVNGLRLRVRH